MWQEIVHYAETWAPAILVTAVGTALVLLFHLFLWRRHKRSEESQLGVIGPLLTFALAGIVVIVVTLTLPIGDTLRGQLLALLGLLFTAAVALSSTTFLGNALAGVMLRAIRHFHPGDYLRVGEHTGRVSGQGLLHTEIQTEDRDLTTLPNLYLVSNPVTVLRSSGTVVSATVSLGYDVDHHEAEELLVEAARSAGLSDPFVQVEELGDFSIRYRAAGFLTDVRHLISSRSKVRKAMLDSLHGAGIEIVSPTFMNQRHLSANSPVLPSASAPRRRRREAQPEARIFDKADEAEARAKMQEELEVQKELIHEIEDKLASASLEAEKASLGLELAEAKTRLERIVELLKERPD